MKLVNLQEMKQLDQLATAEYAVPGILLMDNAAQAVADAVNDSLDDLDGESVVVFCGGGNNGGDGFGAARWLQNYGARVRVFVVGKELEAVTGDAAAELAMLQKTDAKVEAIAGEDDWVVAELAAAKADILVDALAGTGFHGELEGDLLRACRLLNDSEKYIVAVDVPTGVNADNGAVSENAVRADKTVTMALLKTGLLLYPGREYCGDIELADIGMPAKMVEECASKKYRLTDDIVRELLPLRKADAHKGDAGRAVICAGSPGFAGAAALSSYAAVKAGAGLVALYTPLSSRDVLAGKLTEVMVHGLLERMPGILGGGATGDVVKNANAADVLADAILPPLRLPPARKFTACSRCRSACRTSTATIPALSASRQSPRSIRAPTGRAFSSRSPTNPAASIRCWPASTAAASTSRSLRAARSPAPTIPSASTSISKPPSTLRSCRSSSASWRASASTSAISAATRRRSESPARPHPRLPAGW